jgi:hypothetical protein
MATFPDLRLVQRRGRLFVKRNREGHIFPPSFVLDALDTLEVTVDRDPWLKTPQVARRRA